MCPQPPVKPKLRPGLNWNKALPWASDTSRWASRMFTMISSVRLCVVGFTETFTVQTLRGVSLLFFPGIEKYR